MTRKLTSPLLGTALLGTALVLGGCGSDASDGDRATDDTRTAPEPVSLEQLDGQRFETTGDAAVDGHALVSGTAVVVGFDGRTVDAHAGCNHLSGTAEIADGVLSVSDLGGTEMGCPADRAAQDEWLVELLSSQPTLSLDGDTLTVSGADATVELVGVATPDGPVPDPDQPTSNAG
jgi:heat shock protein HslJ